MMARGLYAAITAAALCAAVPARGEDEPPPTKEPTAEELAAAHELWGAGLELEKAKRWEEALEKFEKVAQIKTTPQVRYHLAFCREHTGRLVDALNGYELAIQEARAVGDKAREVTENAPGRIEALRARVAKLRIVVKGTVRTSVITLDGKTITLALLDTPIPVDPGKHAVWVKRGQKIVDHQTFEVSEGGSARVQLTVDDPVPSAKPDKPTEKPRPASRIPGFATIGAGGALLIGSAVFFGLRQATISNIRATCDGNDANCDPSLRDTESLGKSYTVASGVLFGVGLAAVGTGIALLFVLPPKQATSGAASLAISPTLGGLQLSGQF